MTRSRLALVLLLTLTGCSSMSWSARKDYKYDKPALAVITAIVGTAYAAEQTTDGLVQVGKMHRPCASCCSGSALRGALRRALLALTPPCSRRTTTATCTSRPMARRATTAPTGPAATT